MRITDWSAVAFLLATQIATAQVPRDPLADDKRPPASTSPSKQVAAPFVTRQTDVEIPFSVRPGTTLETQPTAVRVFVSWDRGKTWHFYDERKPEDARFRFRPKQDGEYWFATQTVDRSGKSDTSEPRSPQLRLIVDTQRPQLLVQATVSTAGEVHLAWTAVDASLAPASLKIEYQDATGSGGPWQAVELRPAPEGSTLKLNGQTTIRPQTSSRAINLRAEVADAAGNIAYYSQRISLDPPRAALAAAPSLDPSATRWPTEQPSQERPAAGQLAAVESRTAADGPGRLTSTPVLTGRAPVEELLPPQQTAPLPPPADRPSDRSPLEITPPTRPIEPIEPTTAERPRLTSSRRFSLEYDVETVGPEGPAAVELWGTNDGGRTWIKWGADPDKASPFDVEVNHEALYGFRIVVAAKNGLASSTPQPGDAADIWVGVDLTRPTARLTGAAYGQGEAAGKLDIRWQADDANLGSRPITLLVSDRPDGPFTAIASGLPNTGQYYWEHDPRNPRQIYLRLEVRDEAGNVAIDQLTEPIKVEGLEPKARIRGFSAAPQSSRRTVQPQR